ncbi:MAG: 30S ribosomal protein S6 [Lachnospiraceae bacterium]|jgi:small subunit ribosomal protein S6|nr:30S ribosomal protein S6 [Lachnospiraceae bacterium]
MKYELALVVNAKIEDNIRTATVEKVKDTITAAGGDITNVDEVGKKQLAYEIQKMNIGDYYFIQFDAESEAPAQIEAKLRIQDNILRFLCVRQDA